MKIVCTIIVLLIEVTLNAQLHIGAKAGVSIPNLEGNSEQSKGYTSRKGMYGGLIVTFQLTPSLYLQPEVNFSPQGWTKEGNAAGSIRCNQ
jgi:hypothetical protein